MRDGSRFTILTILIASTTPAIAFGFWTERLFPSDIAVSHVISPERAPVQYPDARLAARLAAATRYESMRRPSEAGCLAEAMYYEARGEGVEGQEAVAEVVLERTRDGNYPRTICAVVHEGVMPGRRDCQFSYACD